MTVQRLFLEGLPIAAILGATGIALGIDGLAYASLAPFGAWLGPAIASAVREVREARQVGSNAASAAICGAFEPLSVARTYATLGLWRGRGVYDAAATLAAAAGSAWWLLRTCDDSSANAARWICGASCALALAGLWLRFGMRRPGPPPLLTDILLALDGWQHKRRRTDELSYENAIAARLRELGFDAAQGVRLEGGREADIVVRPKGSVGDWNWRDVVIEMKAHLTTINERDRAMGQLETYASTWPGAIVLMICGDLRRDLLSPLDQKIASLRGQGRPIAIVVKARAASGATR
jgi:hypothetical protein